MSEALIPIRDEWGNIPEFVNLPLKNGHLYKVSTNGDIWFLDRRGHDPLGVPSRVPWRKSKIRVDPFGAEPEIYLPSFRTGGEYVSAVEVVASAFFAEYQLPRGPRGLHPFYITRKEGADPSSIRLADLLVLPKDTDSPLPFNSELIFLKATRIPEIVQNRFNRKWYVLDLTSPKDSPKTHPVGRFPSWLSAKRFLIKQHVELGKMPENLKLFSFADVGRMYLQMAKLD